MNGAVQTFGFQAGARHEEDEFILRNAPLLTELPAGSRLISNWLPIGEHTRRELVASGLLGPVLTDVFPFLGRREHQDLGLGLWIEYRPLQRSIAMIARVEPSHPREGA